MCFLESIEEFPDKLIVKARINTRSDKAAATAYDATSVPGNSASGWDYSQNTSNGVTVWFLIYFKCNLNSI